MIYLATPSGPLVRSAIAAGRLGQLLTHRTRNRLEPGAAFAVDNGVVRIAAGRPVQDPDWSPDAWLAYLRRLADVDGCLFAVVPDVVADPAATDERWTRWAPIVRALGFRAAYATQDGCQRVPADADAVFTGGSDAWKDGAPAAALVADARRRGLWCHMGRVNTRARLRLAAVDGYDSVDGTTLAFGPDRNLPQLLRWLDELLPLAGPSPR